jgi:hypothetical protein
MNYGGTFSQRLLFAASLEFDNATHLDARPFVTHVNQTSAFDSEDCSMNMPPAASVIVAETPSPNSEGTFSPVLTLDRALDAMLDDELASDLFRELAAKASAENFLAFEEDLKHIAELELSLEIGETLNKDFLAMLERKSDLELEVALMEHFSLDERTLLDEQLEMRIGNPARQQLVDNLWKADTTRERVVESTWKALPMLRHDPYGSVGATVKNTFIEILSPGPGARSRAIRASKSVPRCAGRGRKVL